jgi:hypothetical protein
MNKKFRSFKMNNNIKVNKTHKVKVKTIEIIIKEDINNNIKVNKVKDKVKVNTNPKEGIIIKIDIKIKIGIKINKDNIVIKEIINKDHIIIIHNKNTIPNKIIIKNNKILSL